jgi:hypothetical protein
VAAEQEALGYDLVQGLFSQQRILLLSSFGICKPRVSCLSPPVLHISTKDRTPSKVAVLGSSSITPPCCRPIHLRWWRCSMRLVKKRKKQDVLAQKLGHRGLIRVHNVYAGKVRTPQIEDLLRMALIRVAKEQQLSQTPW